MPRRKVSQREAAGLIADLESDGATDIRRSPVRMDGSVVVRWNESAAERERFRADLALFRPAYALAAILVAVVVLVMILLSL
ncbi:MAG: hypothetical protein PVJ02_07275 [Gemmatimonadota bacterium]|jgi:hypothetical protein